MSYVDPKGRAWHPFEVHFESPEGRFAVTIWAISWDHAHLQVQAMRETATLHGQVAEEA